MSAESISNRHERLLSNRFAITILFSSFLLFQIQPMAARAILPWFGGGAMVWCACMLFFQTMLLCGYLLTHIVCSRFEPTVQGIFFLLLLATTIATLDISPERPNDIRTAVESPVWSITMLLLRHVGLPYLTLSAVSPLLQSWFGLTYPGRSPYRLYAVSNFGSLAALISYPFAIEPVFGLSAQTRLWTALYLLFAFCLGLCAAMLIFGARERRVTVEVTHGRPRALSVTLWISIAALSSLTLLAVTNRITNEISVTPVLWVLPLSLYLLSFVLCFDSDRWYRRSVYMPGFFFFAIFSGVTKLEQSAILWEVTGVSGLLFSMCMVCHGELVRLKPATGQLTAFYLSISFGGAVGGLLVALVAPWIFDSYLELPIAIALGAMLILAVAWFSWRSEPDDDTRRQAWGGAVGAAIVLVVMLGMSHYSSRMAMISSTRDFYGVLTLHEEGKGDPRTHRKVLSHGNTIHGSQLFADPKLPTSYFSARSGVGLVLRNFEPGAPRRIGILGLGAGTLAALADEDDYVRFYEIDPAVIEYARREFSYLDDTPAKVDIVLGDARLSLEGEEPQGYDILVLDTFSGDSVPVHLLTLEAMSLYLEHLAEHGVLVVHISSRYYNLMPLLKAFELHFGLQGASIAHSVDEGVISRSRYYLLTRDPGIFEIPEISRALETADGPLSRPLPPEKLWTDDYSNVMMLLYEAEILR